MRCRCRSIRRSPRRCPTRLPRPRQRRHSLRRRRSLWRRRSLPPSRPRVSRSTLCAGASGGARCHGVCGDVARACRGCGRAGAAAVPVAAASVASAPVAHAPAAGAAPMSARQSSPAVKPTSKKSARYQDARPRGARVQRPRGRLLRARGRPLQERQRRHLRGPGRWRQAPSGAPRAHAAYARGRSRWTSPDARTCVSWRGGGASPEQSESPLLHADLEERVRVRDPPIKVSKRYEHLADVDMDMDMDVDMDVVIDADVVAVVCLDAPESGTAPIRGHVRLPASRRLPCCHRVPRSDVEDCGQNPEGTWRNCRPASVRAALSVPLNIAEGSGRFNRDAVRFYTIARGSALECAAILDALEVTTVFNEADLKQGRDLLERIVSMLTGLIKP